ncbi:MAG: hypothetical protein RJP95_03865, partial [Pirellulales bacterium]
EHEGDGFRRGPLCLNITSKWITLSTANAELATEGPSESGPAGLWKTERTASGFVHHVFDVPLEIVTGQSEWCDDIDEVVSPLAAVIEWAESTRNGGLPDGWACPPPQELEELLPTSSLTLQAGRFAKQGTVRRQDSHLSVSMPLLGRVPHDLTPSRRGFLTELIREAQHRTRLVRLVRKPADGEFKNIVAEVDLSGVPEFAAERMLRFGLEAIRHVVKQLVETVEMLVDPTVTSTVWDISSVQEIPAERSQS